MYTVGKQADAEESCIKMFTSQPDRYHAWWDCMINKIARDGVVLQLPHIMYVGYVGDVLQIWMDL